MTNHHTKFEDPWAMSSLVIDHTRFVNGPTDLQTNQPTYCVKQYRLGFTLPQHCKGHMVIIGKGRPQVPLRALFKARAVPD